MKVFLALALLSATILAGCSSSSGAAVTPGTDSEGNYVIHLTSASQFVPAKAKVPVGATVVWVNDGATPHDVQADDGSFSSGAAAGLQEGDSYNHTFAQAGTFGFFCTVHKGQGMRGTLTVA